MSHHDPAEHALRLARRLIETEAALAEKIANLKKARTRLYEAENLIAFWRSYWLSRFLPTPPRKAQKRTAHANPKSPQPATFSPPPDPEVSIVIPVFNQVALTTKCLASLASADAGAPFEVIVADDASTDATSRYLASCRGITTIRLDQNGGFGTACNAGAAAAKGRMLVFLNNDTEVPDRWLVPLLDTFRAHPDAGWVGAKLVYPDGNIQEAGGAVFCDASAANVGNGAPADDPKHNALREVDYCSAACAMIPRALFEKLGGFDPLFAPCYYEDTDLCFRIRQAGYKVLYQPDCAVTHLEGGTAGRDLSAGKKRHQFQNRIRFFERWATELATRPLPGENPKGRLRILAVDDRTPSGGRDAGAVRMGWILRLLRDAGHEVMFASSKLEPCPELRQAGIAVAEKGRWNKVEAFVASSAKDFDIAILSRLSVAKRCFAKIREASPQTKIIFDTVDLHFLRESRAAALSRDRDAAREADATRAEELAFIRDADAAWVVSQHERDLLAIELPATRIAVIPIIQSPAPQGPGFEDRNGWVFIGSFLHQPNADAIRHYATAIHPVATARIPGAICRVIGADAPEDILALASDTLRFEGWIADPAPLFHAARFSIAPLRFGAGVKGKINYSLAHGLPVVASPIAAEGMGLRDGEHLLVADSPEAFADAMVRLHSDAALWSQLAAAGRSRILADYAPETVAPLLAAELARLAPASPR